LHSASVGAEATSFLPVERSHAMHCESVLNGVVPQPSSSTSSNLSFEFLCVPLPVHLALLFLLLLLTRRVPGFAFFSTMHFKFLISIFALASSTAGLSFTATLISTHRSSLLLLAYPYLVSASPLPAIDSSSASNVASDQPGTCEEHRHRQNNTTSAPSPNSTGVGTAPGGHNHTLDGNDGTTNGTATKHHEHHHNCTSTGDGAKPSPTNAVLTTGNEGAVTGNATTTKPEHHHHNCSETTDQVQPSGTNMLLGVGEEGTDSGNSSNHGNHHRHNCSAPGAVVVTQTVLPLPLTSAAA
jgi:hypothetical protein